LLVEVPAVWDEDTVTPQVTTKMDSLPSWIVRIGSIKADTVTSIWENPSNRVHFYIVGANKGVIGGIKQASG
jgi:hypothetical protein